MFRQAACCQGGFTAGRFQEGGGRHVRRDLQPEMQGLLCHTPPGLALVETQGFAVDVNRGDVEPAPQRQLRGTPLHREGLPGARARPFGKNDQVSACLYRFNTAAQQVRARIVADITGGPHRSAGARMGRKC